MRGLADENVKVRVQDCEVDGKQEVNTCFWAVTDVEIVITLS